MIHLLATATSVRDYYLHTTVQEGMLISYKGAFDDRVITEIGKSIRINLHTMPLLSRKLFSIFIEMAQNISYYSAEHNHILGKRTSAGVGLIAVLEHADNFQICAGNLIRYQQGTQLLARCENINSLSHEELRAYKRRLRTQINPNSNSGNIGLIQIALLANAPLQYDVSMIDEEYAFFTLSVALAKSMETDEEGSLS